MNPYQKHHACGCITAIDPYGVIQIYTPCSQIATNPKHLTQVIEAHEYGR